MSGPLFQGLAWVLALLGAALAAWAMLSDRSRGRRRCPRCWYSMEGVAGLKCPECGREARQERRLFKTRRRWRLVVLALFILACAPVVGAWPRAAKDGWLSVVPLRAVVELLPLSGEKGSLGKELAIRLGMAPRGPRRWGAEVTESERRYILRRCVFGNWLARPIDRAWRESYGVFLQSPFVPFYEGVSAGPLRTKDGGVADDELAELVAAQARLPCVLTLRSRAVWPEGMRVTVDARVERWWPPFMFEYVDGTWSANGGAAKGRFGGIREIDIDVGQRGDVALDFDLDIVQDDSKTAGRPRRKVQHETARVAYTTAPTVDEVLPPVSGDKIDDLLSRGLYLTWSRYGFDVDARNLASQGFDDVAFGVDAEIVHGDEVVVRQRIRWRGGGDLAGVPGTTMEGPRPDMAAMGRLSDAKDQPGWSIRLKSDPQWALYVLDAKRYWKGEVVLPMEWGDGGAAVPPGRPIRPAKQP